MGDSRFKIKEVTSVLELSNPAIQKVSELMLQEMNNGLKKSATQTASMKMLPSYVRSVPDGSETGPFLALDLGGTNFRVLLIDLKGQHTDMASKIYVIPQSIMTGTGVELFDHIADCIAQFMKDQNIFDKKLPLGFTFSFPCQQNGLTSAILINWTKGFNCTGVEGEDVVRLLKEAVDRRLIHFKDKWKDIPGIQDFEIDVVAVVNDTVGTLMAIAHKDPKCLIGVIVGTGTNACYMEDLKKVDKWEGDLGEPHQVIINCEWGAFGDNGVLDFLLTEYDREIDKNSLNPGKQIYEKIISGMYLGELARLVLVKLVNMGLLLGGKSCEAFDTTAQFYTKYISEIESDAADSVEHTREVLAEIGYENPTREDCLNIQYVCSLVSRRSAFLAAAGIATIINRINRPEVTVAVDGSVYRYHPKYHDLLVEKISVLIKPELKFSMVLSEDGSGKGAALVAAVACRLKPQ